MVLFSNAFKYFQMVPNGSKWFCFQRLSNGFEGTQTLPTVSKCFRLFLNTSRCFQMLPSSSKLFRMFFEYLRTLPNISTVFQIASIVPNRKLLSNSRQSGNRQRIRLPPPIHTEHDLRNSSPYASKFRRFQVHMLLKQVPKHCKVIDQLNETLWLYAWLA